jgi:hypothetical protein
MRGSSGGWGTDAKDFAAGCADTPGSAAAAKAAGSAMTASGELHTGDSGGFGVDAWE